jgi:hypothetical protein
MESPHIGGKAGDKVGDKKSGSNGPPLNQEPLSYFIISRM